MRAYNTVKGIETYLTSLEGLNKLVRDRHEAGYDRKEPLGDFIILGHWRTDTCGNFDKCTFELDYKPADHFHEKLPPVILTDHLLENAKNLGLNLSVSSGGGSGVPPPFVVCPECDKGWTLANAYDTKVRTDDRIVPLHPGKSIADREKDWDGNKEGVFRFGPEPSVRNAKFIDLTLHPEYKGRVVNEKGWRYHHPPFEHERLKKDYIAEEGDECSLTVFIYEHKRCAELRKARWSREFFEGILSGAGFKNHVMNEIPNEYCHCEVCGPWFLARFPFGDIKIGWRKRVINIDWSNTGKDLGSLFEKEDITKGAHIIHAWGKEKAIDYLERIREALS